MNEWKTLNEWINDIGIAFQTVCNARGNLTFICKLNSEINTHQFKKQINKKPKCSYIRVTPQDEDRYQSDTQTCWLGSEAVIILEITSPWLFRLPECQPFSLLTFFAISSHSLLQEEERLHCSNAAINSLQMRNSQSPNEISAKRLSCILLSQPGEKRKIQNPQCTEMAVYGCYPHANRFISFLQPTWLTNWHPVFTLRALLWWVWGDWNIP